MHASTGTRELTAEQPLAAADARPQTARPEAAVRGLVTIVLAVAAAGIAIRIARLDELVLSFDESYTFATAERSFADMLGTFRFEANGTIYAIVLWPLLLLSEAEIVVRAPALLAGIATIPAVWWTGCVVVGRRAALIAAALVAASPALIGWSQYGRGYAFAILFATLSFGCLVRALRGDGRETRWTILYVLCALATAYAGVTAILVLLPVQVVAVLSSASGRERARQWLVAAGALGAGLVPLLALLYVESTHRDPLAWLWEPDLPLVRRVGGELIAGPAYLHPAGPGLAGAIVATVGGIALAVALVSRGRERARPRPGVLLLLAWAVVPFALLLLVSEIRPIFWARYLGIVVPALALLVAVLLARLPRTLLAVYGLGLAALLLTTSLVTPTPSRDYREAAGWIEARRGSSEPLVLYPVEQLPALAYYARTLRVAGDLPVEEWDDTPLPAGVHGYRRDYDWGDTPVGPPKGEHLARLASRTGSLTVLTYPNLVAGVPLAWATTAGCDVERVKFPGSTAVAFRGCSQRG